MLPLAGGPPQLAPSLHAACAPHALLPPPVSACQPRREPPRSTWQGNGASLSITNKVLIRCAWAEFDVKYGTAWDGLGVCPATFTDKSALQTAAQEYNADAAAATNTHGPIEGWDVSAVEDMSRLFQWLGQFNADISSWDTSSVTDMTDMFDVRSARATPWAETAPRPPVTQRRVPASLRERPVPPGRAPRCPTQTRSSSVAHGRAMRSLTPSTARAGTS